MTLITKSPKSNQQMDHQLMATIRALVDSAIEQTTAMYELQEKLRYTQEILRLSDEEKMRLLDEKEKRLALRREAVRRYSQKKKSHASSPSESPASLPSPIVMSEPVDVPSPIVMSASVDVSPPSPVVVTPPTAFVAVPPTFVVVALVIEQDIVRQIDAGTLQSPTPSTSKLWHKTLNGRPKKHHPTDETVQRIINDIRANGVSNTTQLTERTGLAKKTIVDIVRELYKQGIIVSA